VSVCHTHFDRIALGRACGKYNLNPISTTWLDSARVVRRTWKDVAWKGYGLANVCRRIGYEFQHHDALEDAKAAGFVLLAALRESQQDLDQWRRRVNQPIDPDSSSSGAAIQRNGNPEGDLYGEVIVFTGALELPRSEAADLAAPVRQWVLSLPIPLRLLLAAQPKLVTPVLQVVQRVITRFLLDQAGLKAEQGDSGAVTLIQPSLPMTGATANLNIHLHCLVLDGVYRCDTDGEPVFVEVPAPTDEALQTVLHKVITRLTQAAHPSGGACRRAGPDLCG